MQPEIEALITAGHAALAHEDPAEALRIADDLTERRHTSGFSLGAMALDALGRTGEAIARIETGLQVAPQQWLLWNLLGTLRADIGDQVGARVAFEHGLTCPEAEASPLRFNLASLEAGMGRHDEALLVLDAIPRSQNGEVQVQLAARRAGLLRKVGRGAEVEALVGKLARHFDEANREDVAALYVELARTRIDRGADATDAIWRALHWSRTNEDAAELLRVVENRVARAPWYFRIVLEGLWHTAFGEVVPGFYSTYAVIADTEDEAIALAKRFEPVEVQASLAVVDAERDDAEEEELIGVVFTGPYAFFLPD